tara:strand:- start:29 stop:178 length:150 start_codon:yes stop_codon:yes gene_type:complete
MMTAKHGEAEPKVHATAENNATFGGAFDHQSSSFPSPSTTNESKWQLVY